MVGEAVVTESARVSCVGRPVMVAPGRCVMMVIPGEKPSLWLTNEGGSGPMLAFMGMAAAGMATRLPLDVVASAVR